jgi:cell division protein FtsA
MVALRLESWVYLVTARESYVRNLVTCAQMAGVDVDKIAAIPVAVAKSVLEDDEKELGSVVIDIGENFTHLVVYSKGKLERVASLPMGGYNIIRGISRAFQTSLEDARVLKDNYWDLMDGYGVNEERIDVPLRGDRGVTPFPVAEVETVLAKELEALFGRVNSFLVNNRCKDLIEAGVVLTGGNAKIDMIVDVAERILEMDVRVGRPLFEVDSKLAGTIKTPLYATAAGLLCYGRDSCGFPEGDALKLKGRSVVKDRELSVGVKVAGFLI